MSSDDDGHSAMVTGGKEPVDQIKKNWEEKTAAVKGKGEAVQQKINSIQRIQRENDIMSRAQQYTEQVGGASSSDHSIKPEASTSNGVLMWKIPDIRCHYQKAVNGQTVSLYSSPFYTSTNGYKMCVQFYLNGDGTGEERHLSLFFVIMRSEFDSLLSWPFKHTVTLTLINQTTPSASIVQTFKPDPSSPAFQQPRDEMNVASGFLKFANMAVIDDQTFSHGDTIFLKCIVE